MVKSLHRSLEAKLASIKDPEYDESDGDEEQPETISAKQPKGKGAKHKGRKKFAAASATENDNEPSTVIYLGHLPVGFEEREITVFLNQFGNVKQCRVSRSTKTGRSRGYAFVEFADAEVAAIVATTMSGYFLLEKRMVCHVLPTDKVHEKMFVKPKKVLTKADKQKQARAEMNKKRSAEAMKGITAKLVKREEQKRMKLASLGIDYDFPGYKASADNMAEPTQPPKSSSRKKKKRKMSEDVEETNTNAVAKTPKSMKKKKKTSSSEEEKENESGDVNKEVVETEVKSAKKKKKTGKTPSKKGKTPKK